MQTLKAFLDQSLLIWKDSTAAARLGIGLLLLICVGAVVGVGVWSAQPHYVILASDLEPEKAAKVIDALDVADIGYQVKGSGSIVMVDKSKYSRAQIAAGKLGIGSTTATLEDVSPWMDPMNQQNIFRRNLQRQLETSIQRFKSIDKADVHLSIPEKQPFLRRQSMPSAAVVIEIAPTARFGESQASAIASLVANAVNGLAVDQVSITDTAGNEFTTDASLGRLNKQEEYRLLREQELSQKAETMLAKFLGYGNASVAVTTDFSFPEGTLTTTEVDPDKKVIVSEKIVSSSSTGESPTVYGAAGTASNVGNASARTGNAKTVLTKTEDLDSQYEISKTSRTETTNTPVLNAMTVSVLINSKLVEDENAAVPPEVKERVESLVSQAVGLQGNRDQISVEFFEFVEPEAVVEPSAAIPWDQINEIVKSLSLGLAALVALFVALKLMKKMQPETSVESQASDRTTQVGQLSEMVQQNPEIFSQIFESWSRAEAGPATPAQPATPPAEQRRAA